MCADCTGFHRNWPQEAVVGEAKDLLQQDREYDPENEQVPLQPQVLTVAGLHSYEPDQRREQQWQQPEKGPEVGRGEKVF